MATQASKSIDLQKVVSGAAELEVKALLAGVEYVQVWIGQAARLATIASDTLQAIQHDKASVSATLHRLTDFGKQNAEVFSDLSSRMSRSYYNELDRLAKAVTSKSGASAESRGAAGKHSAAAKKAARRKLTPTKRARRKA
jgi:hypothetical protein